MNVKEIGWEDVDWIHLAQDRITGKWLWTRNEPLRSMKGADIPD
jgi:hypothetical protein